MTDHHNGTMKAIRIHRYGGAETLLYDDVPIPDPGKGQVLIRVLAASINPIDIKLAAGMKRPVLNNKAVELPWTPGCDFSGIVQGVALDIDHIQKGDEVYGNCPTGGAFAEFLVTSATLVTPKPSTLRHIDVAAVPLAAQTAWEALFDHGHLKNGQKVLIHGASGGVGSFAVQLARWKNATVITTSSANHQDYLKSLGAHQVIDYHSTPFETVVKDVDLVIDLIGGETQDKSLAILKPGGQLVSTVNPPSQELMKRYKVNAKMMSLKPSKDRLKQLTQLLQSGTIKLESVKTYPFSEVAKAWKDLSTGHAQGKIVVEVAAA